MGDKYKNEFFTGKEGKQKLKKVLQIVSAWGSGGVERYISNFQKYMADEYQYVIFPLRPTKSKSIFTEKFLKCGGEILESPLPAGATPFHRWKNRVNAILECIQEGSYEIVHINGTMADALLYCGLIKKKFSNVKVIVHCHGDNVDPPHEKAKRFVHEIIKGSKHFKADYCLGCSERALTWMFSQKTLKNTPHEVLYCGIEVADFTYSIEKRRNIRKSLQCSENTLLIGTVGRFAEQKNPMFILDILKKLEEENVTYKFLWIGSGTLEENVKNRAKELEIEDNIIFYGVCSNTAPMYSAMDIFILPSLYEGNPIVGFEAQASGLPCFLSDKIIEEAKISERVHFLPIENAADVWATEIQKCDLSYSRNDMSHELIENVQDAKGCAVRMMEIYRLVWKKSGEG